MARWPMAALLSSAALIARRRRDVKTCATRTRNPRTTAPTTYRYHPEWSTIASHPLVAALPRGAAP